MPESKNNPESFTYIPIGIVHSPFPDIAGMPIQPSGARGIRGSIEIRSEFIAGLKDLKEFSHIILLYAFHRCNGHSLEVKPFLIPSPTGYSPRGHQGGRMQSVSRLSGSLVSRETCWKLKMWTSLTGRHSWISNPMSPHLTRPAMRRPAGSMRFPITRHPCNRMTGFVKQLFAGIREERINRFSDRAGSVEQRERDLRTFQEILGIFSNLTGDYGFKAVHSE